MFVFHRCECVDDVTKNVTELAKKMFSILMRRKKK